MQRLDAGESFCAMEEQYWMLIKQVQGDGKLNNIFTVNLMSIVKRKNKKQNTNSSHCNLQGITTSFSWIPNLCWSMQ